MSIYIVYQPRILFLHYFLFSIVSQYILIERIILGAFFVNNMYIFLNRFRHHLFPLEIIRFFGFMVWVKERWLRSAWWFQYIIILGHHVHYMILF
jgi:hypothetical protein